MSLYSNSAVVKKTIELFCRLEQCQYCDNYFCELNSVGMHQCKYHPGEYDTSIHAWTCCGEARARPNINNPYSTFSQMTTWGPGNQRELYPAFSKGCQRRDCCPKKDNGLDRSVIEIEGIACLVPYMDPPLKERPGFKKTPSLHLSRKTYHPYNNWFKPPPERDDMHP